MNSFGMNRTTCGNRMIRNSMIIILIPMLIMLLLIILFPQVVLFIPKLFMPKFV